jgi:hypothetical protein
MGISGACYVKCDQKSYIVCSTDINSGSYQGSGANLGIKVLEFDQDLLLFIG